MGKSSRRLRAGGSGRGGSSNQDSAAAGASASSSWSGSSSAGSNNSNYYDPDDIDNAAVPPRSKKASDLGSTLIHVGLLWLIVGVFSRLLSSAGIGGGGAGGGSGGTRNDTVVAVIDEGVSGNVTLPGGSNDNPPAALGTTSTASYSLPFPPDPAAGPMGSYPDPLGITDEDRSSFHPVVKFPEVWVDVDYDDVVVEVKGGAGARAGREGGVFETGEVKSGKKEKKKKTGWPWRQNGPKRRRVPNFAVIDLEDMSGSSQLIPRDEAAEYSRRRKREGFRGEWTVGRYDEDRRLLYSSDMFEDVNRDVDGYDGARTVHVGIDLGGPVGTKVYAFADGIVYSAGYNSDLGDYGYVVVIEHDLPPSTSPGDDSKGRATRKVWALYGHLNASSARNKKPGLRIRRGQVLGRMGDVTENGGWVAPHVHFQVSIRPPSLEGARLHDMPGAVSRKDRHRALIDYPDPRIILGPIY